MASQPYLPSTAAHSTPHPPPPPTQAPPPNPRTVKLHSQLQTLSQNISTTQTILDKVLSQITHLDSFKSKHRTLPPDADHVVTTDRSDASSVSLAEAHASSVLKSHISLLHRYNEIKDIAMGLLGIIADREGKRLKDVMDERGVNDKD